MFFFIDAPRDSRIIRVIEWDVRSGTTRVVFEEMDDITVRLRHGFHSMPMIVPLPDTNELIWFSERSGWGHLYLYDLKSGALKHQVTGKAVCVDGSSRDGEFTVNGEWLVRDILHFDAARRELLLQTSARNSNANPYYRDICTVNIDSGALTPLVSGDFDFVVNQPYDVSSVSYTYYNTGSYKANTSCDCISGVSPSVNTLLQRVHVLTPCQYRCW